MRSPLIACGIHSCIRGPASAKKITTCIYGEIRAWRCASDDAFAPSNIAAECFEIRRLNLDTERVFGTRALYLVRNDVRGSFKRFKLWTDIKLRINRRANGANIERVWTLEW